MCVWKKGTILTFYGEDYNASRGSDDVKNVNVRGPEEVLSVGSPPTESTESSDEDHSLKLNLNPVYETNINRLKSERTSVRY